METVIVNKQTELFLAELRARPEVLGVILFGSQARGNNRPDSDVDLIVILNEGYQRAVEERDGQIFEVIYTTDESALEYWQSNKDDAAELWAVAKILFDRDDTVEKLRISSEKILQVGKSPLSDRQREQLLFDAADQLRYVKFINATDPVTANLMLSQKVFILTEQFFDLRKMWTPAPKQRLAVIKEISPELDNLLEQFYAANKSFEKKLSVVDAIIQIVFKFDETKVKS